MKKTPSKSDLRRIAAIVRNAQPASIESKRGGHATEVRKRKYVAELRKELSKRLGEKNTSL